MGRVVVTTNEVEVGLAKKDCPHCGGPIEIRLPSFKQALADMNSPALSLGINNLTVGEREIFDTLYKFYPNACDRSLISAASDRALRVAILRMNKKLNEWKVITKNKTYRITSD